jgi:phosphatidylethanolamine/phosphatidyl-N-methylethanolamine N-methyltransferase
MSKALLLKRFLARPLQVAYVVPSSKALIRRVSSKMDFSQPRVIVEFGPGEGCHTREMLGRMHPDSTLLLFEIDPEFIKHLRGQFSHEPRVHIIHGDAQTLPEELKRRGLKHCDYVISGIPFSYLDVRKKRDLLQKTYDSLAPAPTSAFIIYQVTNELKAHAGFFPRIESEYCLQNFPPMFITAYFKQPLKEKVNGHAKKKAALR